MGVVPAVTFVLIVTIVTGADGAWPRNQVTDRSRSDLDTLKAILSQEIKVQGIQEIRKK